jgi:HEAT repeat protein
MAFKLNGDRHMTKRRKSILFLWILAAALVFIGLLVWHFSGPRHEGRTAREWFREAVEAGPLLGRRTVAADERTKAFEARALAMQRMGRRGFRLLVAEYLHQPPFYLRWYDRLAPTLSGLISLPPRNPTPFRPESDIARQLLLLAGHAAAPELIRRTRSGPANTRGRAAGLLGELGPGSPAAERRLLELLDDASDEVIYRALEVLWMVQPDPDTALRAIVPLLNHTNGRVRIEASYAIGSLRPMPDLTIDGLSSALSDSEGTVRANAARAIGRAGTSSETIVAALEAQLDDTNAVSRFRAAQALARLLDPETANRNDRLLEVVREAEASPQDYFRLIGFEARSALQGGAVTGTPVVDMLNGLLSSTAAYMRIEAIQGIETLMDRSARAPTEEILFMLRIAEADLNGLIRQLATSALAKAKLHPDPTPSEDR